MSRAWSDLLDRVTTGRGVYRVKRLCSRLGRDPDAGRILLVLVVSVLGVTAVTWMHHPRKDETDHRVRIKPMVSPREMQGVIQEAQRSQSQRRMSR